MYTHRYIYTCVCDLPLALSLSLSLYDIHMHTYAVFFKDPKVTQGPSACHRAFATGPVLTHSRSLAKVSVSCHLGPSLIPAAQVTGVHRYGHGQPMLSSGLWWLLFSKWLVRYL